MTLVFLGGMPKVTNTLASVVRDTKPKTRLRARWETRKRSPRLQNYLSTLKIPDRILEFLCPNDAKVYTKLIQECFWDKFDPYNKSLGEWSEEISCTERTVSNIFDRISKPHPVLGVALVEKFGQDEDRYHRVYYRPYDIRKLLDIIGNSLDLVDKHCRTDVLQWQLEFLPKLKAAGYITRDIEEVKADLERVGGFQPFRRLNFRRRIRKPMKTMRLGKQVSAPTGKVYNKENTSTLLKESTASQAKGEAVRLSSREGPFEREKPPDRCKSKEKLTAKKKTAPGEIRWRRRGRRKPARWSDGEEGFALAKEFEYDLEAMGLVNRRMLGSCYVLYGITILDVMQEMSRYYWKCKMYESGRLSLRDGQKPPEWVENPQAIFNSLCKKLGHRAPGSEASEQSLRAAREYLEQRRAKRLNREVNVDWKLMKEHEKEIMQAQNSAREEWGLPAYDLFEVYHHGFRYRIGDYWWSTYKCKTPQQLAEAVRDAVEGTSIMSRVFVRA